MANTWDVHPNVGESPASRPRPPAAAAAAAVLAAATAAWPAAAQQCVREVEKAAFDVRALQSQMMVVALTCRRDDDHNAFVLRHQPGLLSAHQEMASHFRRLHGAAAGQREHDRYLTDLANTQAWEQQRQGPSFCSNMEPLVRRALAARNTGEIALITATANVATPRYPLAPCGGPSAPLSAALAQHPAAAPVLPPARVAPAESERDRFDGYEDDEREKRIAGLEAELERLKRELLRQQEPRVRRTAVARTVLPNTAR